MNKAYSLTEDGALKERPATPEELKAARDAANERFKKNLADWAMRSCWNCNPVHQSFLKELDDGFLFRCFDCGHWYYQGIDITVMGDEK